jgi:hypothetical protein
MEAVTDSRRVVAIDAVETLNDLIGDLVAGTRVLADYHRSHKAGSVGLKQMSAVQKMCLSHLVLAFAETTRCGRISQQCRWAHLT